MTSKIRNPTHIKIIIIKQILRHKILLLPHKITNRQTNSIKKTKKFQTPIERERERERVLTCDKRIVPTSGATQNQCLRDKMTERGWATEWGEVTEQRVFEEWEGWDWERPWSLK